MKNLARLALLLALVVGSAALTSAQGVSVETNNPPPPDGTDTFTSLEGRFTAALPKYSGYSPITFDTPKGRVTAGNSYSWRLEGAQFEIRYFDLPSPVTSTDDAKARLRKGADTIVAAATSKGATLISSNDVSLSGNVGHEIRLESPEQISIIRLYEVGQRVYQLFAFFKKDPQVQASVVKALDSFRLLTPADIEAAMRKRIAEATPSPLPQEPAAKKLKSDAEDEGLKGRVKTVVRETEDLSGTWAAQGRKPSSTDYYNEMGQFTKRELYDYKGNLDMVAVYGYIDGERVRSEKSIRYEYDPPPMMVSPPAAGRPEPKPDPRYSWKFRYRYDDKGRLAEDDWYGSSGRLLLRYTYKYDGDKKEEMVYSEDGSLNQHYLYTLDAKGNEVEESSYDVRSGAVESRYSYGYEFDSQGNWTKQITSKWAEKDGKGQFVPYYVTYRTITYY